MPATDPFDGVAHLVGQTYPGAAQLAPEHALPPLSSTDLNLAWGLDFHYPRGILPLSHELLAVVLEASRTAAEGLPAVTGRGLVSRVVGPHVYTAGLAVEDPDERAERAAAAAAEVAAYPSVFPALWRSRFVELDEDYAALGGLGLRACSTKELLTTFDRTMGHFARAWDIHFDVMYRLLAVLEVFRTVCRAVGIDDTTSADLLASGDTAIHRTDVALRELAEQARRAGLRPVLDRASGLLNALQSAPGGATWLLRFRDFLAAHGQRADSIVDVGAPSWCEDPEQPLGLIRDLLLHEPESAAEKQVARLNGWREQRCLQIATSLRARDRAVFLRCLGQARAANFAWWNEDHNAVIDLRAHLPVRNVAREMARRHGCDPDDGLYLFAEELRTLGDVGGLSAAVVERREFHRTWQPRRPDLPRGFGTPGTVNDPVLAEIIGVPPTLAGDYQGRVLPGLGISPGVARGRARVVTTPDQLHRLERGDILVCEATSPSWTVVFPRLAACVCDSGGALTHAAIICREYGVPCVSAVGVATRLIKDGDLIEVDGTAGTVTVLGAP